MRGTWASLTPAGPSPESVSACRQPPWRKPGLRAALAGSQTGASAASPAGALLVTPRSGNKRPQARVSHASALNLHCPAPARRDVAVIRAPPSPMQRAREGRRVLGVPQAGVGRPHERRGRPWCRRRDAAAACRPAWGRRAGRALRVPTWFLACLYRVCFKASESRAELSTSLASNASSAALRRSSPFPKVGIGSKANSPSARSSTHLHQ